MKLLHNINKWSYGITLLLYITIYLGMIAQIVLGSIQIILAIVLFGRFQRLDKLTRRRLIIYGILSFLYLLVFIVWNLMDVPNTDSIQLVGITVLPMALATFFVFITHKTKIDTVLNDLQSPKS